MKLQIIVATNKRDLSSLIEKQGKLKNVRTTIIHQTTGVLENPYSNTENVEIFRYEEKGISKSRNRGIARSTDDIVLVADDDLVFIDGFETSIIRAFEDNSDADIITFQIINPDGSSYKNYKRHSYNHTIFSIIKVSSVEIAFRRSSILKNELWFDEDFGLGAKYSLGEEGIFLADALRAGLKVIYIPIPIVVHPEESSGRIFNDEKIIARGAKFKRIYSRLSYLISVIFAIKKWRQYKPSYSFIGFCVLIFRGVMRYKSEIN